MTSLEEAKKIAEVLDSKKAQEIKVLKVADLTFVAEYFVLATGTSSTQVKSLAEEGTSSTSAVSSLTSLSRTPVTTTTSNASGQTPRRSNCKSPKNTLYINHLNHKGLLRNESLRL